MMNNIKSYEAIAREAEYCVQCAFCCDNQWYWFNDGLEEICKGYYQTEDSCWKACCVENNLLPG